MKIRSNYVSNSSSSSFIVTKDFTNSGITCLKLNKKQLELMKGYKLWTEDKESFEPKENQDYYLTEYLSDCDKRWEKLKEMKDAFEYSCGGHGGPYDEDMFNEYNCDFGYVYLMKIHDEAKQMSFNKFVKKFKEDYGNSDVIVKYDENGINLKVVR